MRNRSRSDSYPRPRLPEGCFQYKCTKIKVVKFAWEVHDSVCILMIGCFLLLNRIHLSSYLLSKLKPTGISKAWVNPPLLPRGSDTTETGSPSPPSYRAQACQPAAENLPVCLELLGTQASPGEDERQRVVDDRRVGRGGTGGLKRGKRTNTEKEMDRDKTREDGEEVRGVSCTAAKGYSLRIYEALAQEG